MKRGICLLWLGTGFGDALRVVLLTRVLIDNGINAVFDMHRRCNGLVDIPIYDKKSYMKYHKVCPHMRWLDDENKPYYKESIIEQNVEYLERKVEQKLMVDRVKHNHIPVIYRDNPKIPSVDVVMCTTTGSFAPYRNWPHFKSLENCFKEERITYKDLSVSDRFVPKGIMYSIDCLNYVKKCKLYIGLDTGLSYYVSKFANGKTLILQSGYSPYHWWGDMFEYDHLEVDVSCRNCFIDSHQIKTGKRMCKNNHKCMREMSVDWVFDEVMKRLNKR